MSCLCSDGVSNNTLGVINPTQLIKKLIDITDFMINFFRDVIGFFKVDTTVNFCCLRHLIFVTRCNKITYFFYFLETN